MSVSKQITIHLGKKNVKFEVVEHKKVFTAYDLAQTLGTELGNIAKTLLVQVEFPKAEKKKEGLYILVLPASYHADLDKVKKALKAASVKLAPEKVMKKLGIEPGALSPFGSLRKMGVVVDKGLLKTKDVLFVGAESFTESLRMKVKDLIAVESPIVASIGKKNTMKLQKRAKPRQKPKKGKGPKKGKKR